MGRAGIGLIAFLGVALAGLSYAFLTAEVGTFVKGVSDESGVVPFGAAGEYFNLIYGLPVAILSAAIAALVAYAAATFTARQGDIETLRFTEEQISRANERFFRLANFLADCQKFGDLLYRAATTVLEERAIKAGTALAGGAKPAPTAGKSPERPDTADLCSLLATFSGRALQLPDIAFHIAHDPFAYRFAESERQRAAGAQDGLTFLASVVPGGLPEAYLEGDLLQTADNIRFHAERVGARAAAGEASDALGTLTTLMHVVHFMPTFAGHVLCGWRFALKEPRPIDMEEDGKTRQVYLYALDFNIGLALLERLFSFLPSRQTVSAVFHNIFTDRNRSKLAENYLREMGTDREVLLTPLAREVYQDHARLARELVVAILSDEPGRLVGQTTAFYDEASFGPYPKPEEYKT